MTPFQAFVLGLLQGLAEFLPISSSAHLTLAPWLLGWEDPGLSFDVALHFGTLVAVLWYFRAEWAPAEWARRTAWTAGVTSWTRMMSTRPVLSSWWRRAGGCLRRGDGARVNHAGRSAAAATGCGSSRGGAAARGGCGAGWRKPDAAHLECRGELWDRGRDCRCAANCVWRVSRVGYGVVFAAKQCVMPKLFGR